MTDINRPDSSNLDAVTATTGAIITANRVMTGAGGLAGLGCTLANATTYFFPFGAQHAAVPAEAIITAIGFRWGVTLVATISIEDTLFPASTQAHDPRAAAAQLTDFENTLAGFWIPENPSTAYVPVVGGTFNPANMTVSVPGGTAGGCIFHLGNMGTRRGRGRVAVTTGDVVRCGVWGKGF